MTKLQITDITPVKVTIAETSLIGAAVIGTLYQVYGEDPLVWKKMKKSDQQIIDELQDIHFRLENILDPWETDMNYLPVTFREANFLRLCFRVFCNCFPDSPQKELQDLFRHPDTREVAGKGLLSGLRTFDNRLLMLIRKEKN